MTVEIVILSGSRQGERLRVEELVFQAGGQSTDAVSFDPEQDPGCRSRQVRFWLEEGGWRVRSVGSLPVILNQDVLEGAQLIRAGDIVRLSEDGPDFSFHLARGKSAVASPAIPEPPPVQHSQATTSGDDDAASFDWKWVISGAVIVVSVIVVSVIVALWIVSRGNQPAPTAERASNSPSESGEEANAPSAGDAAPKTETKKRAAREPPDRGEEAPAAIADPKPARGVNPEDAIYLLAVKHPDTNAVYPYGTGFVIREDTLLTSATLATELDKRRRAGWQILAAPRGDLQELAAPPPQIRDIRIHMGFQSLADSPAEQIFFDLALLTISQPAGSCLELADMEELGDLKMGQPIECLGIPHEGDRVTRFDDLTPQRATAKILYLMPLPAEPGGPGAGPFALLHLEGAIPANMYGSPILSERGKVIGVYAERAELPPELGELEVHYAALVTLASAWLSGEGAPQWVPPAPLESEQPKPEP